MQEAALRRLRELEVLREREKFEAEAAVLKLSQEKDLLLAMTRETRGKASSNRLLHDIISTVRLNSDRL